MCFGWHRLGWSASNTDIIDDCLNQSSLRELKTLTSQPLDVDANIVRRVPLILNLQTKSLELRNDAQQLLIRITDEDALVYIDNEDGVAAVEDTVFYQRLD